MANYRLTRKAEEDIFDVYEYGIINFGLEQAQSYAMGMENHFKMLARNPMLGRSCEIFAPNLMRFEYQSHVIFYQREANEVLIVRILGSSMDFVRHF